MRRKAGKCPHIIENNLCELTKNWARTFDDKGEPLNEYEYAYCHPDNCLLTEKKEKSKPKPKTNEIIVLGVRPPLERIEYAYDKMIAMLNEGKIKLKEKDHPFFLGYLATIKMTLEEIKGNK